VGGSDIGSRHTYAETFCFDLHLHCIIKQEALDAKFVAGQVNMLVFPLLGPSFHALTAMGGGLSGPSVGGFTFAPLDGSHLINAGVSALKVAEKAGLKLAFRKLLGEEHGAESKDQTLWQKVKAKVVSTVKRIDPTYDLDPANNPLAFARCLCDYMIAGEVRDESEELIGMRAIVLEEFGGVDFFRLLLGDLNYSS
jgi:hypothetical protein